MGGSTLNRSWGCVSKPSRTKTTNQLARLLCPRFLFEFLSQFPLRVCQRSVNQMDPFPPPCCLGSWYPTQQGGYKLELLSFPPRNNRLLRGSGRKRRIYTRLNHFPGFGIEFYVSHCSYPFLISSHLVGF